MRNRYVAVTEAVRRRLGGRSHLAVLGKAVALVRDRLRLPIRIRHRVADSALLEKVRRGRGEELLDAVAGGVAAGSVRHAEEGNLPPSTVRSR